MRMVVRARSKKAAVAVANLRRWARGRGVQLRTGGLRERRLSTLAVPAMGPACIGGKVAINAFTQLRGVSIHTGPRALCRLIGSAGSRAARAVSPRIHGRPRLSTLPDLTRCRAGR